MVWLALALANVITFSISNAAVCFFGLGLSAVNLMGFIRCEKNHKEKVRNFLFQKAQENLTPEQMLQIGMQVAKASKDFRT